MKILFLGDIVGRSGRDAVVDRLPALRKELGLDFVVANGENAAGGYGITGKICQSIYGAGVDAITTGNHVWDQREIIPYIEGDARLLRPQNFPKGTPGRGAGVFRTQDGKRVAVLHVMLRLFMDALDDPFACVDALLSDHALVRTCDAIVLDIHGEATSEKQALGYFADGRVSLVVGTHTHVPTADGRVLPKGTAYISDAGMCGDYESVIGMQREASLFRFTRKMPGERLMPAEGEATLCGVLVETDDRTGLAKRIQPLRLGGILDQTRPG
ncbi:MAG: TIGR00282 family metallophosphoesterase [Alphaproteobacteria bacterium]|nr:TIGR00282 family metallophosphoesterase [Alphaproteobacteria bacterium]